MEKEASNVSQESRRDKLQRIHDEVKIKTEHVCRKPCAVCNLFYPGQRYIDQQRKKEEKHN